MVAVMHVRGRPRPSSAQPSLALPLFSRPPRSPTSRYPSINSSISDQSPKVYADLKKTRPASLRFPPTMAAISTIALIFFVFGIVASSKITVVVSPGARDLPLVAHSHTPKSALALESSLLAGLPSNFSARLVTHHPPHETPNRTARASAASAESFASHPPLKSRDLNLHHSASAPQLAHPSHRLHHGSHERATPTVQMSPSTLGKPLSKIATSSTTASQFDHVDSVPGEPTKLTSDPTVDGSINWNRSWPLSPQYDQTHLIPLAKALHLNDRTLLNYFHMHKTGGVTLKAELMTIFNIDRNRDKLTKRGQRLSYKETCYEVVASQRDNSLENTWRCDLERVKAMNQSQLDAVDLIMGHQYWDDGTEMVFSKMRDVRHFSIFRHPLPRKLSFFYHFFVRNLGRDESKVSKTEVIEFLLGKNMPQDSRIRDAGPNYYASRMMSDGLRGFVNHRFELDKEESDETMKKVIAKLDKKYVLVGLQLQSDASLCMMERLLQVFAHEHGVDNLVGTQKLSFTTAKMNSGRYPWTSRKIWDVMTPEQRKRYKEVEKVDLAIYAKATQRFREDAKLYSCEDKVLENAFAEDVFE